MNNPARHYQPNRLQQRMLEWVEYFVHPSLAAESTQLNRTRILITGLLLFSAIDLMIAFLLLFMPLMFINKLIGVLICLVLPVCSLLLLERLRRHGDYLLASTIMILIIFGTITAGIMLSGGPATSPATQLLLIPILVAYFLGGRHFGKNLSTLAMLMLLMFAFIEIPGELQPSFIPPKMDLIRLVMSVVNLLSMAGLAFIYEYSSLLLKRERDYEQEQVIRLARTDALTGLANRRDFDSELQHRAQRYRQHSHDMVDQQQYCFALCYIDLDGFKPINDQYGHDVGDEVLRIMSDKLRRCLRDTDYVGRHGGDEFMVIFDGVRDVGIIAMLAERLLKKIREPIVTSAGTMHVTASLGFALFPADAVDTDTLKDVADKAMYDAKATHNSWALYTPNTCAYPPAPSQH